MDEIFNFISYVWDNIFGIQFDFWGFSLSFKSILIGLIVVDLVGFLVFGIFGGHND